MQTAKATAAIPLTLLLGMYPADVRSADPEGVDGDPGVEDLPQPPPDHPVLNAVGKISLCGSEPGPTGTLKELLGGITAEQLVLAIEDGTIRQAWLVAAIEALAEIGAPSDLEYVLNASEDISWEHLADVVEEGASDQEILARKSSIAGHIRGYVVSAWASRGAIPKEVLMNALWDPDSFVRARAVHLALDAGDESLETEALEVCDLDEYVGSIKQLCP